jgi:hypothetical protein
MNKLLVVIFVFVACLFGYLMFSPIKGLRGLANELEELNSRIDRLEMVLKLDSNSDEEKIK